MKIIFDKFVNIGKSEFEPSTPLTILIGNNGVGKTLLLETYTRINDYLLSEVSRKSFFYDLLSEAAFQFEVKKIEEEIKEEDGRLKNILAMNVEVNIKNPEEIKQSYLKWLEDLKRNVSDVIKKDILFSKDESLLKNLNLELESDWCDIFEKTEFNIIQDSYVEFEQGNTKSNDFFMAFPSIQIEDINENKITSYFITEEEFKSNKEKLKEEDYSFLISKFMFTYGSKLETKFLENNNLDEIIYIPSERIVSMSKFLERQFSNDNYDGLRYSEEKFAKTYVQFKEYYSHSSNKLQKRKVNLNDIYNELLGGEPIFNSEGDITAIKKENNEVINRSLFSTKQNKIYPFFLLHSGRGNFHSRFRKKRIVIIEEPEANLSTKSVIEMAKYIKKLNEEYTIILSTHSDVFLTQLNNLYLKENQVSDMSGYEILEKMDEYKLKNLTVSPELGVNSEFISEQLHLLYETTSNIQNMATEGQNDYE